MKEGWIKLHRQIIDSRVFANPEMLKLWLLCLVKANHKKAWVDIDGLTDPVEVKPGQFITGRYSLHRDFYPKKTKNMKSEITLWRWIKKLERWGKLNIKTNNKFSLITILKWEKYQNQENNEQQNEQQVNSRRTTDEQQVNTNKNDKNDKNDKNISPLIENYSNIKGMEEPLTENEGELLIEKFGRQDVEEILMQMENWKPLQKKNKSANLTAQNWLKKRNGYDSNKKIKSLKGAFQ